MKFLNNKHGFGHIEAFLFVVLVVGVAFIGYHALNKSHADSLTASIAAPSGLRVNANSSSMVVLAWNPPSTENTTVELLKNGVIISKVNGFTNSIVVSSVKPATAYKFTLETIRGSIHSPKSAALSIKTPKTSPVAINTCNKTIGGSGLYVLNQNLALPDTSGSTCITVNKANNLIINCKNHTITDAYAGNMIMSVQSSTHFAIVNCVFLHSAPSDINNSAIAILSSNNGTFENNKIESSYSLYQNASTLYGSTVKGISVLNNTFQTTRAWFDTVSGLDITGNTLTWDSPTLENADIGIYQGTGNVIALNKVSGYPESVMNYVTGDVGTDDGIDIGSYFVSSSSYETNDVIASNNISDIFDCGVEGVGTITNVTIEYNTITDAQNNGICSYWYTSWSKNNILYNTVALDNPSYNYGQLFAFEDVSPVASGQQAVFNNNNFTGNTFAAANGNNAMGGFMNFTDMLPLAGYLPYQDYSPDLNSTNSQQIDDTFTANNFDANLVIPPILEPTSMVIDGGNNVCLVVPTKSETSKTPSHEVPGEGINVPQYILSLRLQARELDSPAPSIYNGLSCT